MLALRESAGTLRVLVHPDLSAMVQEQDFGYLQSLLQDFKERALLHPASLFKQLCSLGSGPLVTQTGGTDLSGCPMIHALTSKFVML